MRGTSRASLQSVRSRFEPVLAGAGVEALRLGEELFALVDALDSSASLRRTLTDPSVDADAKGALAARLLTAADPRTLEVARDLVGSRWSTDGDLGDAAEELGFHAVLASAESDGGLVRGTAACRARQRRPPCARAGGGGGPHAVVGHQRRDRDAGLPRPGRPGAAP